MSVLRPDTLAILRTARPAVPLFSNMVQAEAWYARATIGPYVVHRRTTGDYVLCDTRLPMAADPIAVLASAPEALAALDAVAAGKPFPGKAAA